MDEKETFEKACLLFDGGDYFEAHEVWEELWNEAEGERNAYLQSLIQVAAALHHASRQNWNGTRKLLGSSLLYLEKGRRAARAGEVDPEKLKEEVASFELQLREHLAGTLKELTFFKLPRG